MRSYAGLKASAGFRDQSLLPLQTGLAVYNGNDLSAVAAFNTWLGRTADLQTVFFDSSSWANFAAGINYETNLFTGLNCVWSVPLACQIGTLPAVIAGTYDSTFFAAANAIVANAPANTSIIIRLGWEFNLTNSVQCAFDGSGNPIPATWVSAYQHVVNIFRSVSGRFRFVWNPNIGDATDNGLTVTDCYPGDSYVDYVGLDSYFNVAYDSVTDLGSGYFGYTEGQGAGLTWIVNFAATHNKAWCVPEWGVNSNSATTYMSDFCSFLAANNCAFHGYWNSNGAFTGELSNNQYPAIGTTYQQYFGLPVITNTTSFSVLETTPGTLALTTNQDSIYTMTWAITGGSGASNFSVSGSTLSWGSVAGGTQVVTLTATNSTGHSSNVTFNVTFAAPYTFTNTEAASLVARMTTTPTETRKAYIDTYVGALKTAGIWTLLDTLYVFAAQDAADGLLNWITNANNASVVSTPSFTINQGYTGSYGTGSYVSLNRPGNASGHLSTNSASAGYWELTNFATNSGSMTGGGTVGLNGRNSSNVASISINDYSPSSIASTNSSGFWHANRSASAARQFYWNGSSIGTDTVGSSAPGSASFIVCAENPSYPDAHQISMAFTGGSLSSGQASSFYTATYNYLHSIGTV